MKLSGRMTRSTDECEMSRSCHSAMFSSAAMRVGAKQPREPDDLLAADRVALVRHRRRALLPLAERLLDLADFGLLQPADLERELLERRADDRERRSSARRDGRAGSPATRRAPAASPSRAHTPRLDRRIEMRERADGARDLADRHDLARARSTRSRSRWSSAYQSASFKPNVIGSACTPCVRPIIGVRRCSSARAATASISRVEVLDDQVAGLAHLQRLRGVDDIGRGEAEVQPARRRARRARRPRS